MTARGPIADDDASAGPAAAGATLVIHDGGLAALVACLLVESAADGLESEGQPRPSIDVWAPPGGPPIFSRPVDDATRRDCIERQADVLALRAVHWADRPRPPGSRPDPLAASRLLLDAVETGVRAGCDRVLWPIWHGPALDAIHAAVERAAFVEQLAAIDLAPPGSGPGAIDVRVETPFAELTASQLLDLARDLDAPLELCWHDSGARAYA